METIMIITVLIMLVVFIIKVFITSYLKQQALERIFNVLFGILALETLIYAILKVADLI